VKPGWVRVNFNYFISEAVFQFILDAVHLVADHGHKLLPYYQFDPESGLWHHRDRGGEDAHSLNDVSYASGAMEYPSRHTTEPETVFHDYLDCARQIVTESEQILADHVTENSLRPDLEALRWFPLPGVLLKRLK
jgi:hypothetical protein